MALTEKKINHKTSFFPGEMGISKNRGTPKWMVYNGKPIKWMIWGYPYFRKHPNVSPKIPCFLLKMSGHFPCFFLGSHTSPAWSPLLWSPLGMHRRMPQGFKETNGSGAKSSALFCVLRLSMRCLKFLVVVFDSGNLRNVCSCELRTKKTHVQSRRAL